MRKSCWKTAWSEKSVDKAEDKILIGQIVGVHGIRGDLKVKPTDPDADWLEEDCPIYFQKGKNPLVEMDISHYRRKDAIVILSLEQIKDRNQAETWVGTQLYMSTEDLPTLEEDAFRIQDLLGLSVLGQHDQQLKGAVTDILFANGEDFLEIQLPDDGQKVIIPFQNAFFPVVDLPNKRILLDKLDDLTQLVGTVDKSQKTKPDKTKPPSEPQA